VGIIIVAFFLFFSAGFRVRVYPEFTRISAGGCVEKCGAA
jgi:hypothetical protein